MLENWEVKINKHGVITLTDDNGYRIRCLITDVAKYKELYKGYKVYLPYDAHDSYRSYRLTHAMLYVEHCKMKSKGI